MPGPEPEDPIQTSLCNCWFMAAVSTLAEKFPGRVRFAVPPWFVGILAGSQPNYHLKLPKGLHTHIHTRKSSDFWKPLKCYTKKDTI